MKKNIKIIFLLIFLFQTTKIKLSEIKSTYDYCVTLQAFDNAKSVKQKEAILDKIEQAAQRDQRLNHVQDYLSEKNYLQKKIALIGEKELGSKEYNEYFGLISNLLIKSQKLDARKLNDLHDKVIKHIKGHDTIWPKASSNATTLKNHIEEEQKQFFPYNINTDYSKLGAEIEKLDKEVSSFLDEWGFTRDESSFEKFKKMVDTRENLFAKYDSYRIPGKE